MKAILNYLTNDLLLYEQTLSRFYTRLLHPSRQTASKLKLFCLCDTARLVQSHKVLLLSLTLSLLEHQLGVIEARVLRLLHEEVVNLLLPVNTQDLEEPWCIRPGLVFVEQLGCHR